MKTESSNIEYEKALAAVYHRLNSFVLFMKYIYS